MSNSIILYFLIGIFITFVGSIPLGLVNLSVMDEAIKNNLRNAIQTAHGASIVEILYALLALFGGEKLSPFFEGNQFLRYFISFVLLFSGLYFWFKTEKVIIKIDTQKSFGLMKGILLNIISMQVLLYWFLAITVISAKHYLPHTFSQVLIFLIGVWLAKNGVLHGYIYLAQKIANKLHNLSANTNRIIGFILLLVATIQFINF